ncbi:MAG TPA: hypothetical protein VHK46_01335 [Gaiellaceae bacterium]|nr:hypothetical protein [Gaiellaceae bacterium]
MELVIDRHFRGPTESANGGYTCGVLASLLHGPAEVTLRLPPPLERPLEVVWSDDRRRIELRDGEALVAEAEPAEVELGLPDRVSFEEAAASALPEGDTESAFPECFVCGWSRDDGLGIYAGPLEERDAVAATWTPSADHVAPEFVWAALDCPGAYAVHGGDRGMPVLGRLAAKVEHLPRAGEPCVVMAWPLGGEGRKLSAGTVVYGEDGRVLGSARATWITPREAK